uniref:Missing-in-metastasis, isoform M n=1 Tax=Drosophila melanogaster TaxID=7227 RepID=A0A0B4KED3_DROME|nr:missing-in-metastasis, isoform M [Drosophila melanogaster]AGB93282.1 missing-in-metastasis, isoform M [Drosophila melanogaster]|eukprot:NP_001260749.1 missing-in-metastasis, isoform M [Drosophila melanogaster]
MDLSLERDSSALGSLFQQIINDMKNTSPLWEDFVAKAGKLHTCLRAAIQAIAAYLDAFQKIADAATNSRGASKEIGTALTRVCLRHKAVETRLKTFTSTIMDCLVQPLQERIEDWKRTVATIDKDHAKEYKRCRSELKKRSSDTLRLQKKARKGQTDGLQSLMDSHMQDVTLRRAELEEVEKKSLRAAMVEERLRYCSFVHMLQPVVHEECEVMSELGHLQEAMQSIALVTKEPSVLPQASEELIHDAKASINLYPESPGGGSGSQGGGCSNSLGSRKSSVCSISSMNSSGSSNSPGHHHYPRSLSQFVTPAIRLKPGESSDSGFCSSPALTTQTSNATNQTANVSTWPPHSQDGVDTLPPTADRPHTISTAYEKGHQRPPLTVYTFQNPETIHESGSCLNNGTAAPNGQPLSGQATPATQKSPAASLSRPPLPVRCSSLERPLSAQSNHRQGSGNNLLQRQCPSPIPAHITKDKSFEDSIQALNNLIGELDSFQREIDEGKVKPPSNIISGSTTSSNNNNTTTSSISSSDNNNLPATSNIEPCAISNQTNSSGCGTDISDTTSDELAGDDMDVRRRDRDRDRDLLGASDSELSRCYVSETSSLTGGLTAGGYENPTFAHFAANANREDAVSLASDSVCLGQPRHAYVDTCSDSGSAVVVIYDHQIPNTPDIEFVKQNSEIVVLRTKDPQPHALQLHEMRELQQLPANLAGSPDSSPDSAGGQAPPTATVAPAKQRLSSFRATSEQQLQLLGRGSPQRGGAAGGGSTRIGRRSSINQSKPPPPVRRSSSVTPSPNASVGLQQQPQHATLSQQNHQLSSSSEHLPPPPPFMLDAMPQIPSSALKVSETSAHNSPLKEDLTVYYDSYLDLHAYAQALASGQQPGGQQMANQQRFTLQQQHQHLHQPQQPPVYQVDATFRTSSPAAGGGGGGGIYAQPKLVNSMSSFRTSSPSPNGHAHPLPPTQPKANPNLIAQLNARLSGKQQQHQQQQHIEGIYGNQQAPGGESIYMRSGLSMSQPQQQQHFDAAAQSPNMRQAHSHQHHQPPQQQHYTCPPPLEDPPPPPIYAAGASATMPKKMARPPTGQNATHSSAYAAASSTATLPKNMMQQQQRLQHQQQYQQPAGMGIGNGNGHLGQRPQLPLPQQKLRAAQQQHLAEQQHQQQQEQQQHHQQHQQHQQRQPPIPSRHSSVQQKIFVSTNPFIQTTAVKFHSPSASPTCGSPVTGSLASIYATTSRGGHHHQQQQAQQQQHYYRDAAGGNSNGGAAYYNHNAHAHSQAHHPTGPSHLSRIADGSNQARSHLKA